MNRLRQPEVLVMEEGYATTMRLPDCMTRWSYACGHKGQANSTHYHSDLEDKQPDLKCGMTSPNSINQIFEDEYRFAMTIKAAKDMVEPFDIMYMGQSRSGAEIHAAVLKSRTLYANSRPRLNQEIRTMEEAFAELSVTLEKAGTRVTRSLATLKLLRTMYSASWIPSLTALRHTPKGLRMNLLCHAFALKRLRMTIHPHLSRVETYT